MTTTPRITKRQQAFLRAFRTHPSGPPRDQWPSPPILRKWLRRPTFKKALDALQETLTYQTSFHLTSAAANAATDLHNPDASCPDPQLQIANQKLKLSLLRLAHPRPRLAAKPKQQAEESRPNSSQALEDPLCFLTGDQAHNDPRFKNMVKKLNYTPPLERWPHFPDPVPQDTFYYNLLQDPSALLWYLKLYQEHTLDYRFSPILSNCKHLLPRESSWTSPFPRFASQTNPPEPQPAVA